MVYKQQTSRTMAAIEQGLTESAARNKFGIIATHDLQETMKKKGVDMEMECRIFEVCNPHQAKRVLEADGAVSTALPCRISVYGKPGGYTIATMLPTGIMAAFGDPSLEPVAQEVEAVVLQMVRDAAGVSG